MNNISKIRSATVYFCDGLAVEGFQLPDGNYAVSITSASKVLGYAKNWLGRSIDRGGNTFKALQGHGFSGNVFEGGNRTNGGTQTVSLISEEDFRILVDYEASKKNENALKLKGVKIQKKARRKKNPERVAQMRLSQQLNGETEVQCLAGRIDILTNTEVIEVKKINNWKSAIGQVLVYGHYYPSHKKRIHLIGGTQESFLRMIKQHASQLGVDVTWSRR